METKLNLNFLDYQIINLFNYISIGSEEKKIKINQNFVQISLNNPDSYPYYDHFTESINLITEIDSKDKDNIISFNLDLYVNEINEYYCLINCRNKFSFDIIIFQKEYQNFIKTININGKEKYILTKSNTFGLKNCKKFGIINCDKSYLNEFNFYLPEHINQGSYYLNVFYTSNNEPKYSLQKIKLTIPKNISINNLSKKENFFKLYNKYKSNSENIDEKRKKFYAELVSIFKNDYNFSQMKNLEFLLSRNIKLNLDNEDYNICLGYIIYELVNEITIYINAFLLSGLIINLINNLQSNLGINNLNILRVLFWYKKYYISNDKFISKVAYFNDIESANSIQSFSLCYPKKCNKNTPYNNAILFMENFFD